MIQDFPTVVNAGPLVLAVLVASVAGLASFLSPCVLPLVPGYLSYVTGLAGAEISATSRVGDSSTSTGRRTQLRMAAGAALFVSGFSAVFVAVSVTFTRLGVFLIRNDRAIEIVAGALTILLGAAFLGALPGLQNERKVRYLPRLGLAGAPVLGVTFALGWSPCVTPTLGAVIGLSTVDGSTTRSVVLAIAYSAGLGLPFLGFALFTRWGLGFIAASRPHRWITSVAGGLVLIAIGISLISGEWSAFMNWLRASVGPTGLII